MARRHPPDYSLADQLSHLQEEEEEEGAAPGAGRVVPEDMLMTDTRVGLTSEEVLQRRKKYGLNQMKEEKENLFLKFLGFFVGPVQFVMEVSLPHAKKCFVSIAKMRRSEMAPHTLIVDGLC